MLNFAVKSKLVEKRPALESAGIEGLFAFGSRVRGDYRDDSDLDLFIEFDAAKKVPSLIYIIHTEQELEAELGFPVSITTRSSLHPRMKAEIESYAERVF